MIDRWMMALAGFKPSHTRTLRRETSELPISSYDSFCSRKLNKTPVNGSSIRLRRKQNKELIWIKSTNWFNFLCYNITHYESCNSPSNVPSIVHTATSILSRILTKYTQSASTTAISSSHTIFPLMALSIAIIASSNVGNQLYDWVLYASHL